MDHLYFSTNRPRRVSCSFVLVFLPSSRCLLSVNPALVFTGLRLTPSGNLVFQVGSSIKATVAVGTITGTPDFLSYNVDFSTGALSNIVLQGISADFSSLITASTVSNYFGSDDYVSVFGGGSAGGQFATVDNLSVSNASSSSVVPEPASLALFGIGGGALSLIRRRRSAA